MLSWKYKVVVYILHIFTKDSFPGSLSTQLKLNLLSLYPYQCGSSKTYCAVIPSYLTDFSLVSTFVQLHCLVHYGISQLRFVFPHLIISSHSLIIAFVPRHMPRQFHVIV